ncbi:MAG: glycosyltransferase 87 family protein [Acidobacteriota bacterium]
MALERDSPIAPEARARAALFLFCAAALVALRLWLAIEAPRLYEFDHYWIPIAQAQAQGLDLWRDTDYHFFPPWAWLLGGFRALSRGGDEFAAVQRTFLTLVDVAIAALLYRLAGRVPGAISARAAALSYLANPVPIWVNSVQGQFDGLSVAFLMAALLGTYGRDERRQGLKAGVMLGLSVAAKQITLMHPLLWLRRRQGAATVAAAYAVPLLTLLPYAASWRTIARSLLVYYSVPRSYGLSELVLYDPRFGPAVGVVGLIAALGAIVWLRHREPARACLFLFLVLLFVAPGLGSQYLLWPMPFGALFGGVPYVVFSAASILWILGSHFGWPGSGQWMGQLIWLTVGIWMFFESRALTRRAAEGPA